MLITFANLHQIDREKNQMKATTVGYLINVTATEIELNLQRYKRTKSTKK